MEKWEYKIISPAIKGKELGKQLDENLEGELNLLGNDGWALVNIIPLVGTTLTFGGSVTQKIYFVFKREIK